MTSPVLPGATLGVLGGGQLGRMFCTAARSMGYSLVVMDPDKDSPAGQVADTHICKAYDDSVALDEMAAACDVITTEFENIPATTLAHLAARTTVYPAPRTLEIAQHRAREKMFAQDAGLQPAAFHVIEKEQDIADAFAAIGAPTILKSATLGYDGKGQAVIDSEASLADAWQQLGSVECVLEKMIDIDREISVIVARNPSGDSSCFPAAENVHVGGILHTSAVPAGVDEGLQDKAATQAKALAEALAYVGVLAVEFFVSKQGELLFNEMAPRPHNSGHYTKDACVTSQYEQLVRMICGLPVGDTRLTSAVVMVNMLGELWEPDWQVILGEPAIKLHLYGKKEARPGRKMGHYNVLADSVEQAMSIAERVFEKLSR